MLEIKRLHTQDAGQLSALLLSSEKGYSSYFVPFSFDKKTLDHLLAAAKKDLYFGLYVQNRLAGFYMLRGMDDGFEIPSYGVWIDPAHSGKGLAKTTVYHACSVCQLMGAPALRLKVHPDNVVAKSLYEKAGFEQIGIDEKIGHFIYIKKMKP